MLNLIAGLEAEKKRNQHDPVAVANIDSQIGQLKEHLDNTIYSLNPTVPTPDQLVQQSLQDRTAAQVLLNHTPQPVSKPPQTGAVGTKDDAKELNAAAQALDSASHSNKEIAANLKEIVEKAQGLDELVMELAQATKKANGEMERRMSKAEGRLTRF